MSLHLRKKAIETKEALDNWEKEDKDPDDGPGIEMTYEEIKALAERMQ